MALSASLMAWPIQQSGRTTDAAAPTVPDPVASGGFRTAVHYVSPAGNNNSNGSATHPWATIQHADRVVQPGDTVVVLNGTYSGDIVLGSSGTKGKPITYVAQHKWEAKLVGTGSGAGSAVIRVTGGHLVIKNFDITGTDAAGVLLAASGTSASFNQAIGNYVHDLTTPCDDNGGAGLVRIRRRPPLAAAPRPGPRGTDSRFSARWSPRVFRPAGRRSPRVGTPSRGA